MEVRPHHEIERTPKGIIPPWEDTTDHEDPTEPYCSYLRSCRAAHDEERRRSSRFPSLVERRERERRRHPRRAERDGRRKNAKLKELVSTLQES